MRARVATTVGGAAATVSRLAGKGDGSVIGGIIGLRLGTGPAVAARRRPPGRPGHRHQRQDHDHEADHRRARAARPARSRRTSTARTWRPGSRRRSAARPSAPVAVLETDEKYIPAMVKATKPKVVVLLNLSRDQMDRAAEIWLLARRWREALGSRARTAGWSPTPTTRWSPGRRARRGRSPGWPRASAGARTPGAARNCGAHLQRDGDDWSCKECGLRRPPVSWMLHGDEVIDPSGRATTLDLALPGRANRSNAVIALAVAEAFGVHLPQALARAARGHLGGGPVHAGEQAGLRHPAAARQEPGRLARGARRASRRRRRPSCSRSTRRGQTAGTPHGCGTWTSAGCAAGTCWSAASAGSTSPSGSRPTRWRSGS